MFLSKSDFQHYEKFWLKSVKKFDGSFIHTPQFLEFLSMNGFDVECYISEKAIIPIYSKNVSVFKIYKVYPLGDFKNELHRINFDRRTIYLVIERPKNSTPQNDDECYFIMPKVSIDVMWNKFINKKARNSIRKAIRKELNLEISNDESELKKFYRIYKMKMAYFNTKPYTFESLKFLLNTDNYKIFNVYYNDKIIAGGTVMIYNNKMINHLAASYDKYLRYCPNNFLYWKMIEFALENKYELNLGISNINSGVAKFKISMGGKPIPCYEYVPINSLLYNLYKLTKPTLKSILNLVR